jgi:hypothetical protein
MTISAVAGGGIRPPVPLRPAPVAAGGDAAAAAAAAAMARTLAAAVNAAAGRLDIRV